MTHTNVRTQNVFCSVQNIMAMFEEGVQVYNGSVQEKNEQEKK